MLGRRSHDDPPPRAPRNLWTGDWLSESERARRAAEEAAAAELRLRHERDPERRADGSGEGGADPGDPDGGRRRRLKAMTVAVLALVIATASAVGWYLERDDTPDPLPAVSGKPIKPKAGQTRAGAVYAQAGPAVVAVRAGSGQGTGFLIDPQGTIVTNAHVVGRSERVTIRFGESGSISADVQGTDPSSDLAVVKVPRPRIPEGAKPLRFADSRQVSVGDVAIAIGNPFGLDRTATEGIVSGLGRTIEAPNGFSIDEVIQTDAPINPGNSGGPLLDETARVIGVNSQIATAGSQGNVGIGFAVPSNTVRTVVPRLQRGEKIERGYLGVETSDTTTAGGGAEVQTVVPGGPAERAGLRPGDIIKKIDGAAVADSSAVSAAVSGRRPGDDVEIEIDRSGRTETIDATLGTRPARTP